MRQILMIASALMLMLTPASAAGFQTGCYVEGSAGIGINQLDLSAEGEGTLALSGSGLMGGIGGGCDYRMGAFLIGALGGIDLSSAAIKSAVGDETVKITDGPSYRAAVRIGFTPLDHLLIYGLAGGNWSKLKASVSGEDGGSGSETFNGYTLGAGADFLLNDHITLGARYTADLMQSKGDGGDEAEPTRHTIRAVLGYRF